MAARFKVGSFTPSGATGAQAITGVGFTPKALLIWASGVSTVSGTWVDSHYVAIGMTSGPTQSRCVSAVSAHNTSPDTYRRASTRLYHATTSGGTVGGEADLTSFDVDGFTLNWAAAGNANVQIMYLAIGGDAEVQAKVVDWNTPASTATTSTAVTGVGFKPDLVLHMSGATNTADAMPTGAGHCYLGVGCANKQGQQWSSAIMETDGVGTSNTTRWQQADACLLLAEGGDAAMVQAHHKSMDADGFTVNWGTVLYNNAFRAFSLCLKGISSKAGSVQKSTAAAPAAQAIGRIGFTPKAALFAWYGDAVSGAPSARAQLSLGAGDGTTQRSTTFTDLDASSPTSTGSAHHTDAVLVEGTRATGGRTKVALSSLASDTINLSVTLQNGGAEELFYLALGDDVQPTYPVRVG